MKRIVVVIVPPVIFPGFFLLVRGDIIAALFGVSAVEQHLDLVPHLRDEKYQKVENGDEQ